MCADDLDDHQRNHKIVLFKKMQFKACLFLSVIAVILGGIVACNQNSPPAQTETAVSPTPAIQELEIPAGDVTLFARVVGNIESGNVLIANNGGPGLTSNYMHSLEELAGSNLAVVTYDQRGNGRSSSPQMTASNFELSDYAADVEAIRDALGVSQVHLLGHSFGGVISMVYATRYPQHVRSLILLASGPPTYDAIQNAQANFGQHIADLQAEGTLPPELENSLEAILPAYFSDPTFTFATDDPGGAPEHNTAVNDLTWQTMADYDLTADLATLDVPVLILYGADDPFGLPMAEASRDALVNADVTYVLLDQCGHFWHECPEATFAAIRPFLETTTPK